jgi:ferredoxin
MAMSIDPELCTSCGDCEPVCPTNAIVPKKGIYFIKAEVCTECEGKFDLPQCVNACMTDGCINPVDA